MCFLCPCFEIGSCVYVCVCTYIYTHLWMCAEMQNVNKYCLIIIVLFTFIFEVLLSYFDLRPFYGHIKPLKLLRVTLFVVVYLNCMVGLLCLYLLCKVLSTQTRFARGEMSSSLKKTAQHKPITAALFLNKI